MSPSELEEMFLENPDKPHRLTLSSGDRIVVVPNSQVSYIHGISLGLVRFIAPGRLMVSRRQLVSIPNIVVAEVVDRPSPPPRRRRK